MINLVHGGGNKQRHTRSLAKKNYRFHDTIIQFTSPKHINELYFFRTLANKTQGKQQRTPISETQIFQSSRPYSSSASLLAEEAGKVSYPETCLFCFCPCDCIGLLVVLFAPNLLCEIEIKSKSLKHTGIKNAYKYTIEHTTTQQYAPFRWNPRQRQ
jgi:hypothetical protein